MKIYTRGGDKGKTSLIGGTRVDKFNIRVDAYGTIDELNSVIGVAIAHLEDYELRTDLMRIQHNLFDCGADLANPDISNQTVITKKNIQWLEQTIDKYTECVPPLQNFILPGGAKSASYLHLARTVARRAERKIATLAASTEIDSNINAFINRLSDYLFASARYVNWKNGEIEPSYNKGEYN